MEKAAVWELELAPELRTKLASCFSGKIPFGYYRCGFALFLPPGGGKEGGGCERGCKHLRGEEGCPRAYLSVGVADPETSLDLVIHPIQKAFRFEEETAEVEMFVIEAPTLAEVGCFNSTYLEADIGKGGRPVGAS